MTPGTVHANPADRPCPLCRSARCGLLPDYSKDHWRIVRCGDCGMVYLANPPAQELLKGEYAWEHSKGDERARRRENRKLYYFFSDGLKKLRGILQRFRSLPKEIRYIVTFSPGKRVLDVGCGAGQTLDGLPDGYVPYGIEPSPGMCAEANARYARRGGACIHDVAVGGFARIENPKYDFIVMRSFLEHDSEAMATLEAARDALADNGGLLVKVPNLACWNARLRKAGWPGMRYPDHVNYFTPATLRAMLQRAGYSRIHMPLHWQLPTSDNLWVVAFR